MPGSRCIRFFLNRLQSVPDATPTAVQLQMSAIDQIAEVQLQSVSIAACQLDRLGHRDAAMLTGKRDDLQGQRGQWPSSNAPATDIIIASAAQLPPEMQE